MNDKVTPLRPDQIMGTNVTQLHGYAGSGGHFRQPEKKPASADMVIGTIKNRDAVFNLPESVGYSFIQASALTEGQVL